MYVYNMHIYIYKDRKETILVTWIDLFLLRDLPCKLNSCVPEIWVLLCFPLLSCEPLYKLQ